MTGHHARFGAKPATIQEEDGVRIAVVVLTMNQKSKTLRTLESLRGVVGAPVRILLWDNGSHDGTAAAVRESFPAVLVHHHPGNLGVASGRNAAARLAMETLDPTHLLFLDNDMIVDPGFVEGLLTPFREDPRVGQTQAKLRFLRDPERLNDGGGGRIRFWLGRVTPVGYGEVDRGQHDAPADCIACGGAMLVRADLFFALGGFDPVFDPFGPEDLDFSLRLRRAGYRAVYAPRAMAYHEVSHTFEGGEYTERYATHKARHWLRFIRRHASLPERLGFLLLGAPYALLRVIAREGAQGNLGAVRGVFRGAFASLRADRRSSAGEGPRAPGTGRARGRPRT